MTTTDRRVLVTGGSGFIGTNLIDRYLGVPGTTVINLDISAPRNPQHRDVFLEVDLCDPVALRESVQQFGPTDVFHMAARTDLGGPTIANYRANTDGVENLLAALKHCDAVKRAIFASSRMVCRIDDIPNSMTHYSPPNAYGESKVVGERLVREAQLAFPWAIVRPTSIWGPWFDIPYKTFFLQVANGRYVHVGQRNPRKSFGYVGNMVYALDLLMERIRAVSGQTLYLADYEPIEVVGFSEAVREAFGAAGIKTVQEGMIRPLAIVGDLLQIAGWRNVPLTSFRLRNLLTEMVHDVSDLQDVVGPLPFTMQEGVAATAKWMQEHGTA